MTSQTAPAILNRYPSAVAFLTDEVAMPYNRIVSRPEPGVVLVEPIALPSTVRPFLTDEETDALSALVEKETDGMVDEIWFDEQHTRRGYLAVAFNVDVQCQTGEYYRDEDSYETVTCSQRDKVTVRVYKNNTLFDIAKAVASEILGIEGIYTR